MRAARDGHTRTATRPSYIHAVVLNRRTVCVTPTRYARAPVSNVQVSLRGIPQDGEFQHASILRVRNSEIPEIGELCPRRKNCERTR